MAIHIIEPPEIVLVQLQEDNEDEYSFDRFVEVMLNMPEWNKNWRSVQDAIEIDKACKDADGQAFELSDRPYSMLKNVTENPSQGYPVHPLILRQLSSYFEAILNAKKKGVE